MDHSCPRDWIATPPLPEVIAVGARVVSFLHGGGRTVVLAGPGGKTILDLVLDGMPGRLLRVSGGQAGPLELDDILEQIGAEAPGANDAAALVGCLIERAHDGPAVLVIDDAHTVSPAALPALSHVPGLGGPDLPGAILLLAGDATLPSLLAAPGLERLSDPRSTLQIRLAPAPLPLPASDLPGPLAAKVSARSEPGGALAGAPLVPNKSPSRGWLLARGVIAAAVLIAVLTVKPEHRDLRAPSVAVETQVATEKTMDLPAAAPDEATGIPEPVVQAAPAPIAPQRPEPVVVVAPVQVAPPVTEPAPVERPASDTQLRQEFAAFLKRAGPDTAQLTASAREELFRQYLDWRGRAGVARASGSP